MRGVVFLELNAGRVATFDFTLPSGVLIDRATGTHYAGPNRTLGNYRNRVKACLLDSGGRSGDDNAWCNFKCSGCFRPLQATRWHLIEELGGYGGPGTGVRRMLRPENSLGNYIGSRRTGMDPANLRPYRPQITTLPAELSDEVCWLGFPCAIVLPA
jgi:hypothetical protein